jgi:RTX calcium-binding nonapeptide repeat (4 copies)
MAHASDAYAGLASVNGSALAYVAVPGEVNTVALSFTPNAFTLTDTTAVIAAGIGCAPVTTHQVTCPSANNLTPSAAVDVGNMNDVVSLASVPSSVGGEISGGDGDDSLTGGPGPDRIAAGPGNDTVNGAAGDDITFSGTGADTSMGGPGTDLVTYSARDLAGSTNTLAVTVSLDGDPK